MKNLGYIFFSIVPALFLISSQFLPVQPETGLMVFNVGLGIGCLAFLLGVVWVFENKKFQGLMLATVSSIYVFLALGVQLYRMSFPPILDVSTDTINPPPFIEIAKVQDYIGRDLLYPQRNKSLQEKFYPKLAGITVPKSAEAAYDSVLQLLKKEKGVQILAAHPDLKLIEATAVSGWFRFQEDFVVRITELEAMRSKVDIRARNRSQQGETGANFRRIVRIFTVLDENLVKNSKALSN